MEAGTVQHLYLRSRILFVACVVGDDILWRRATRGRKSKSRPRCIEESKKNLDENGKPHGIPFEDFVKELLGDDYTEDWYPEEEQERDRRNMAIASYKGNKEAEYLLLML